MGEKQVPEQPDDFADAPSQRGLMDDPMLEWMKAKGVALTRENWLDLSYGDEIPTPWTAELESHVPPMFRKT